MPKTINARYQLAQVLGQGGMGIVYEATDRLTKQAIALKQVQVKNHLSLEDDFDISDHRLAISREFQTLASLRHPNIISVFDYGFTEENAPFFTMDLLQEPQPISVIPAHQSLEDKVQLLLQVLQALAYLHRRGIIHRDIKPTNILVCDGRVKVLDFGIAATGDGGEEYAGTIAYAAPEVLVGKRASEASDLYAFGVIAYELFAGHHPFNTRSTRELISDILVTPIDLTPLLSYETKPLANQSQDNQEPAKDATKEEEISTNTKTIDLSFDLNSTVAFDDLPTMPEIVLLSTEAFQLSLTGIISKLLSKDYKDRYQEAKQVIHDLSRIIGNNFPFETQAMRESFLQAASFIGRDAELTTLLSALTATKAGSGTLWLVSGESGVGKSRLLQEVRIHALVQGFTAVIGQSETEGAPYQIWRGPLRQLVLDAELNDSDLYALKPILPDIEDLLERPLNGLAELNPEQAQQRLFAVFAALLHQRTKKPLLIILEDLQWASSESLALLTYLQQSLPNLPVLIIGSYRNDETVHFEDLFEQAEVLKLDRLKPEAIVELSISMIGAAATKPQVRELLQKETEGNVYFLVEVIRALAEEAGRLDLIGSTPLPEQVFTGGVKSIVRRRLDRVAESMYPLLKVAAALGRELDLSLLRSIASDINLEPWLLSCADAGVLEIQENQWRFAHHKLREGIISAFTPEEEKRIYQQAAQAIEAVYVDLENHAAALAYHWGQAGDKTKELQFTILAGEQTYRVSDNLGAVAYFSRALDLVAPLNPAEQADRQLLIKVQMAKALGRLSRYDEAIQLLQECMDLSKETGKQAIRAEAVSTLGRIAIQQGDYLEATDHLLESLSLFRQLQEKRGLADTLVSLGQSALYQGDYKGATQHLNEGLALFRELGHQSGAAYALSSLGMLKASQDLLPEAIRDLQESILLYQAAGNRNGTAGASMNLGMITDLRGDHELASEHYMRSLSQFRELGDQSSVAACLNNLGFIALNQQKYVSAQAYFLQSLHITQQLNDQWGTANIVANLGKLSFESADLPAAKKYFKQALQSAKDIGALPLLLEVLEGFARLKAREGDMQMAVALLRLIINHPATDAEVQVAAQEFLIALLKNEAADTATTPMLPQEKLEPLDIVVNKLLESK
ncbi:MAG: tetratricopeptide repeat protein [Anaerolineae bacterium]|nr:tetratricopeptide repeat protein [Anaerolineae bacterium]